MKHKTWFRLVLKAIGVLLIGLALPEVATLLSKVGYRTMYGDPFGGTGTLTRPTTVYWDMVAYVRAFVQLGLGLYLLFGGRWIADTAIPSTRPYCPECGYDISEATGKCCPECGVRIDSRETTQTGPEPVGPQE